MFNYYFDAGREGHNDVVRLFEAIGAGVFEGYASQYVVRELKNAPEPKRSSMLALMEQYGISALDETPDADNLAKIYIEAGIIPKSHPFDSLHIAAATVYRLDCIVSYNFKHINRARTQISVTGVNNNEGYGGLTICTAEEVMDDERQNGHHN
ncbi:MAG: hypothetical protein IJR68_05555 [Fretibacterium sp.]|nr:hypothetical protein [Fretibacterium sp.]